MSTGPSDEPLGEPLGPLDPELEAAVAGLPAGAPGLGDIVAMREFIAGSLAFRPPPDEDRVTRQDVLVPGPPGAPEVTVRLYRPRDRAGARPNEMTEPRPVLVWCHGGGFVFGDLEVSDTRCIELADDLGAVVVAVDYRLAPEHPFPAAVDDAHAVTRWVGAEASGLGADPGRIAVGGSSAGATLAAGVALRLRDEGGPAVALQVLWQPATDDRCNTPSSHRVTDPRMLHRQVQLEMWDHYLGPEGARGPISSYAAPARAEAVAGLPPAVVVVAEHDPLRDEGLGYAQRLEAAGVPVRLLDVPGAVHGFEELKPDAAVSRRAHRWLVNEITALL